MAGVPGEREDPQTQILLAIGGVLVLLLILGYLLREPLVFALLKLAHGHLAAGGWLYPPFADYAARLDGLHYRSEIVSELTIGEAAGIAAEAMRPFALAIAAGFAVYGLRLVLTNPLMRYRRQFTQRLLLERNARHFPAVRPMVGLNLLKTPTFEGPWRVAEDYIRFALRHGLVEREVGDDVLAAGDDGPIRIGRDRACRRGDWLPVYRVVRHRGQRRPKRVKRPKHYPRDAVDARRFRFNAARARAAFVAQLGAPLYEHGSIRISQWSRWPVQHRALMAAFLLIGFGPGNRVGREAGLKLLEQFNTSFYHPDYKKKGKPPIRLDDLDMRGVDQVLAAYLGVDYQRAKGEAVYAFPEPEHGRATVAEVRDLFRRHAYLNVLLIRLLDTARQRGVLITSDFLWLRPVDRTLFYCLNNAGRHNVKNATVLAEGAGAMAHYMVEDTLGAACLSPAVDNAVTGLEQGVISEGWLAPRSSARRSRRGGGR